jgi:hypothetical protein
LLFLGISARNLTPGLAPIQRLFNAFPDVRGTPFIEFLFFIVLSTLGAFSYLGKLIQNRTGLNLMLSLGLTNAAPPNLRSSQPLETWRPPSGESSSQRRP